jgi:hypothetical protein
VDESPWLRRLPRETIGADLLICPAPQLSKGNGPAVLRDFSQQLAAQGHACIIIDPDPANLRALCAYEKAGFRPIPELLGCTEDALIMQFNPTRESST